MPTDTDTRNGWNEWSRHVLAELKRLSSCYESLDLKLSNVQLSSVAQQAQFQLISKCQEHRDALTGVIQTLRTDAAVAKVKLGWVTWGIITGVSVLTSIITGVVVHVITRGLGV
jgi:hypothetical protein